METRNLDDFLLILSKSDNWNWIDLRLVDTLAFASDIREACRLVENYRDFAHSIKLRKVLDKMAPHQEEYKDKYIDKVGRMINKEPYQITVGDLEKLFHSKSSHNGHHKWILCNRTPTSVNITTYFI